MTISNEEIERCYAIAKEARSKGLDPSDEVEIVPARDLAARVEGIVGPKGIAQHIREIVKGKNRTQLAFAAAEAVLDNKFGELPKERQIEQALRTGTAILTEGVLVAPTEGISQVKIRQNPDSSSYLEVYYSGPIRSAGGTAAALSVLIADFLRRKAGIGEWRPTETAVERYLEEIEMYDARAARLQYKPSDDDFRLVVRNCPICVGGDPTEEMEVVAYRNVPGIDTNRVRGGMALVLCEGIAQKAAKVLGQAKKQGMDWNWLEAIIKAPKAKETQAIKAEPIDTYLDEVVAGRPVVAYPSRFGGFRLRYGRSRISGFMAKGIHPATMVILDSFPAIGTQFKLERPGKGCIVTPCDTIEPPVVKLDDGSVVIVETKEMADEIKGRVTKILMLGDILVSYGDFLKSNTLLFPAGYNEEWWYAELKESAQRGDKFNMPADPRKVLVEEAFSLTETVGVPLHPKWTYYWNNITGKEVKELIEWLRKVELKYEWFTLKEMRLSYFPTKGILEKILMPHRMDKETVIFDSQHAFALTRSLGLTRMDGDHIDSVLKKINDEDNGLEAVNKVAGFKIMDKAGTWIGSRMGRPEKSRERHMKPLVHSLFPIANAGGKLRNVMKAYRDAKANKLKFDVNVEIARMKCQLCGAVSFNRKCPSCGAGTSPERVCSKCGKVSSLEIHTCGGRTNFYDSRPINVVKVVEDAILKCKQVPEDVKCVTGLMSERKIPEPIEKGILRAVHGVSVFKEGTCRFDATNAMITQFYPREVGTNVAKLKEMGYMNDAYGKELTNEEQLVELMPHDMIVSDHCLDYMSKVAGFVDDMLVKLYGMKPFYNLKEDRDLIGHLVITLSPHTSCGIASRIIGTTRAHVCYGHPYLFAASRRDCFDGKTMMYYQNDNRLHTESVSEMFKRYADAPKVKDKEWELIDLSNKNVFALGTDTNGSAEKKKIRFLMRKSYSGPVIKIIAENNQEIIATPDHRMWVFDTETKQLKEKRVKDLTENDLLASLATVDCGNKVDKDELDLLEIFSGDEESRNITVRTDALFAKKIITDFGKNLKKAGEHLGMSKRMISNSFYRKPYSIPLRAYMQLEREKNHTLRLGFKRNHGSMPTKIKVTDKLLRLIGYYISEGCAWVSKTKGKEKSYHISIAASDPIIKEDIKDCIKESFGVPVYENKDIVCITNKLCYKLFTQKLKLGCNAYEKDIPDWILNLPVERIRAFIGGCYQGDGSVSGREIKYCTVSEVLASKMFFLLTRLGMSPTFKIEKDRPTNSKYLIEIYKRLKKEPPVTTLHYLSVYSVDSEKFADTIKLIGKKGDRLKAIEKLNRKRKYIKSEKDMRVLTIKSLEHTDSSVLSEPYVYDIQLESNSEKIFACGKGMLLSHNCDADEDAIMLMMDGLINFSKLFLPRTRGGQMDAPIVMMTIIDPTEVDDQVHALETATEFPTSFYEASLQFKHPSECKIKTVSDHLGTPEANKNLWFTYPTSSINNGVVMTSYVFLKSMNEKIEAQLGLGEKIAAVDSKDAAERLVLSHFFPDLYGNLRAFSRQQFRCLDCNMKHRRIPLSGKCNKCGGKLLLTVNKGGVKKYLKIAQGVVEKYQLPSYLKQRLVLLEKNINSVFEDETTKQFNIAEFM